MRVIVREQSKKADAIEVWWESFGNALPLFWFKFGDTEICMSIEAANALCAAMKFTLDGPPKERK